MSTINGVKREEVGKVSSNLFSKIRSTVETTFYGNNVVRIKSLEHAYQLAKNSPGTIETGLSIYSPEKLGLPLESNVLIFNDGRRTGRTAAARRIIGEDGVDEESYASKLREAVYNSRKKRMYHASVIVGMHEDFMVKAHLLIPEGHENILYSWMLNFQNIDSGYSSMYL